jgi:nuclear transport factor 2 (NTF2) superfamily protein
VDTNVNERPPLPPFSRETAIQKIRMAEDAWNTRDPERIALAYTKDSVWRNRTEFVTGREDIIQLLKRKWERENEYRLIKELGHLRVTVLPYVLRMNGEMIPVTGSVHTAMRIGCSIKKG